MPDNPFTDPLFADTALTVGGALLILLAGAVLREWRRSRGRSAERALLAPVVTASIVVALLMVALFAGGFVLMICSAAIAGIGTYEYATMTSLGRPYTLLLVIWSTGGLLLTEMQSVHVLLLLPVTLFLSATIVPVVSGRVDGAHRQVGAVVFGYLYIGLPMAYLLFIRSDPAGLRLLLVVIAGAWLADTCGYAIGSKLGGPKLAPTVSPDKTWSGAAGSVVGAMLGVALLRHAVALPGGLRHLVVLGAVTAIGAVWGDLVESFVKRDWRVKDAGVILPGFGGVLDRFDSLFITIPATYYVMLGEQYFGR